MGTELKRGRVVYVFARMTDRGFEVVDAGGAVHLVSGYLACVDGRVAVKARVVREANGLYLVHFIDGQECWVLLELPEYQLDPAA